jgi:survival-of-motor-neuron-related-splicing factor 30
MDPEVKNNDIYAEEEEDKEQDVQPAEGDSDNQNVKELKQTIADYQEKLNQIDELIKGEKDDATKIAEMELLKKEIQSAIDYSSDLIKLKESDQGKIKVSMRVLTDKDKGKVCEGFFNSEQQWFAGKIIDVNVEDQTAEIDWIGFTEKSSLPAKYIKIAKHPDSSQLEEGYVCESLYTLDGNWYPCMIERIFEDTYFVKFRKFGNKENVPIEYLRLKPEDVKKNKEKEKEGLDNFVPPEKLKYKSTDTEDQKLSKKKKLKALKFNHKKKIFDKANKEKQETWMDFQHKASRSKKGHYQTVKVAKESIFKTPDNPESRVGVVGSGQGMSSEYRKRKHVEYQGDIQTPVEDRHHRSSKRRKYS